MNLTNGRDFWNYLFDSQPGNIGGQNGQSYTWREVYEAVKTVGEANGKNWGKWFDDAGATRPQEWDVPYSGPPIEGWPIASKFRDGILQKLKPTDKEVVHRPKPGENPNADFRFEVWPTVSNIKSVTQKFNVNPNAYPGYPGHEGIDLDSPEGTPYYAVAAGTVRKVRISEEKSGYGTYVLIDHGNGYTTLYAHAIASPPPPVEETQKVNAGQTIAYSGSTGNSSGPHLHLTLKKAGHVHQGWEKPGHREFMDPGPFVTRLLKELVPTVTSCYIYQTHLKRQANSSEAFVANPNYPRHLVTYLRDKPNQDSGIVIAKVPNGTRLKLLADSPEKGYYRVELLDL